MGRISILAPKLNKFQKWKRGVSNTQKMIFRGMFGYSQSGPFSNGHTVYPLWSHFLARSQSRRRLSNGYVFFYVTIQFVPHGEHRMQPSQRTMGESFFSLANCVLCEVRTESLKVTTVLVHRKLTFLTATYNSPHKQSLRAKKTLGC